MGMMAVMDVSLGESPAAKKLESSCGLKTCNATDNLGSNDSEVVNIKGLHSLSDTQSLAEEGKQDCHNRVDSMHDGSNINIVHETEGWSVNSVEQGSLENGACGELFRQLSSDYVDIFEILEEEIRAAEARELEEIQSNLLGAKMDTHSLLTIGTDNLSAIRNVLLKDGELTAEAEGDAFQGVFERDRSHDEAVEAGCNDKMEFQPKTSASKLEQSSGVGEAESNVVPYLDNCETDFENHEPQNMVEKRDFDDEKVNLTDSIKNDDGNPAAEKRSEPLEDEEFNSGAFSGSIAFSGMLAYSGLISYSGQIPHSGNLSLHSDSSTSTRSFAFPILASDWNSSPAKIGQPDSRYFRRRRRWRPRFCCRRPATLFD